MANFKVVFRSDNQGADTSPGWEPGCPLLVNAVQVSRNTDTGQCYLQLKLSNISGATVNSFKLQADVSYVDGANETAELNPLDADIQPRRIAPSQFYLLDRKSPTSPFVSSPSRNPRKSGTPPRDPHLGPFPREPCSYLAKQQLQNEQNR